MKLLLLSDTHSEHTEKWALGLANSGIEVGLFSFNKASYEWYKHPNITVFFEPSGKVNSKSTLTKLSYVKYLGQLKKAIQQFAPDILHAHYASSYGLLGALSGFHPFVLSVWGSDVYSFPTKSKLHKKLFQYNLKKADAIMSTSEIMKAETAKYTHKNVVVTPFGVNVEKFYPQQTIDKQPDTIYIGTIKPIEIKYGIIYIIEAAEILVAKHRDKKFKFLLIGSSQNYDHYRQVITEKKLENYVEITGRISFDKINEYHNLFDIFLNVSIDDSESFGVAAVESMACAKPVIVTDVGGLKEVVNNGEFGQVIPKKNTDELVAAIERVLENPEKYAKTGRRAREHVIKTYNWQNNLAHMINEYEKLLTKRIT